MESTRKRKLGDCAEASLSRVAEVGVRVFGHDTSRQTTVAEDVVKSSDHDKSRPTTVIDVNYAMEGFPPQGHSYKDVNARDQSRVHLGDNITLQLPPSRGYMEEERIEEFMKALAFDRMEFRRHNVSQAHAETCRWMFREEKFLRWRDPALRVLHHGFFWIKGKPGSGKSTMMKCILEHLERQAPGLTVISFFFNARGERLEKTIEGCYRSLLYQLLKQVPRVRSSICIPACLFQNQDWPVSTVKDLFRQAVLALHEGQVVLFIDALDECDEDEVRDMVDFIEDLAKPTDFLDTCFATRHYPNITALHREELVMEKYDAHQSDILDYIASKLNTRFEKDELKNNLVTEILHKAQGVFLWAVLVVRLTNKNFDRGATYLQLLNSVRALPGVLDELIGSMISQGASDPYFLPAMMWTLIGHYSMSVEDMYHGIKLGGGEMITLLQDSNPSDLATMERFILHASKGLIELTPCEDDLEDDSRLNHHSFQFIHESVRQYIIAGNLAIIHSRLSSNVEAESHAIGVEWCIMYTQLPLPPCTDFPTDEISGKVNWKMLLRNQSDVFEYVSHTERIRNAFPFLQYVYYNTFHHLHRAYVGKAYDLRRLQTFPLEDWIHISNALMLSRFLYVSSASLLHLLLERFESCIDTGIFKDLLAQQKAESQSLQRTDNVADMTAPCSFGNLRGDVNHYGGGQFGTPLVAAAIAGLTDHVQLLIKHGASVNSRSHGLGPSGSVEGSGETPLIAAARGADRSNGTVELLLSYGADIDARGGGTGSALGSAAYKKKPEDGRAILEQRS